MEWNLCQEINRVEKVTEGFFQQRFIDVDDYEWSGGDWCEGRGKGSAEKRRGRRGRSRSGHGSVSSADHPLPLFDTINYRQHTCIRCWHSSWEVSYGCNWWLFEAFCRKESYLCCEQAPSMKLIASRYQLTSCTKYAFTIFVYVFIYLLVEICRVEAVHFPREMHWDLWDSSWEG